MTAIGQISVADGVKNRIVADARELQEIHQPTDSSPDHHTFCRFCGPAYRWPCTRRQQADSVINHH